VSSSEPYFEGLSLARLDSRGDEADVHDEMRALLSAGGQSMQPPYEGQDASGSVWVSVSARVRVDNVEFSSAWPDRLQPGDVARALFESYNDAKNKAYTAAALTAYQERQQGHDTPASADASAFVLPPDDDRAWLRAVRNTLEDIEVDIHQRSRGEIGRSPEDTVSSSLGCFRARVQGNAVVDITGDSLAIRGSSADQLRREAMQVFQRAQGSTDDTN
jgi:hypothetical protein